MSTFSDAGLVVADTSVSNEDSTPDPPTLPTSHHPKTTDPSSQVGRSHLEIFRCHFRPDQIDFLLLGLGTSNFDPGGW